MKYRQQEQELGVRVKCLAVGKRLSLEHLRPGKGGRRLAQASGRLRAHGVSHKRILREGKKFVGKHRTGKYKEKNTDRRLGEGGKGNNLSVRAERGCYGRKESD